MEEVRGQVNVIYTSVDGTQAALRTAAVLSRDLGLSIRLLAFQVVPTRLSMDEPPVPPAFAIDGLMRALKPCECADVKLEYVLCRDREETMLRFLASSSTVVLGGRNSFIRSAEKRLANRLLGVGHDVIFVPVL